MDRRLTLLPLLTLVLLGAPGATAQEVEEPCVEIPTVNDRCPEWSGTYGLATGVNDVPRDVVVSPDGNTVVTLGTANTMATYIDWTVVANTAASGARKWVVSEAGPGTALDTPSGLAITPDSARVLVAGSTCEDGTALPTCDMIVRALDLGSGTTAWRIRLDAGDQDTAGDIALSPDGSIAYLAGLQTAGSTGADASLTAIEASDGDVVWTSTYDGSRSFDAANELAVAQNGERVYVTGPSDTPTSGRDYATVAFDAEDGERLWVVREDHHGGTDTPTGIAVGQGRVAVTGATDGPTGGGDYATYVYDAQTGGPLWDRSTEGQFHDLPLDLSMGSDGSVYVTGMSRAASGGYDFLTVAYGPAGASRWSKRFNGLGNNGDAAWSVEVSPDGQTVYISGDTLLPGGIDYAHTVIAYDADDGAVLWQTLHRGGGSMGGSQVQGLDVSPDGSRVYYAGMFQTEPDEIDFLTLAYDAT
jgi:WD40 repeat protein